MATWRAAPAPYAKAAVSANGHCEGTAGAARKSFANVLGSVAAAGEDGGGHDSNDPLSGIGGGTGDFPVGRQPVAADAEEFNGSDADKSAAENVAVVARAIGAMDRAAVRVGTASLRTAFTPRTAAAGRRLLALRFRGREEECRRRTEGLRRVEERRQQVQVQAPRHALNTLKCVQ